MASISDIVIKVDTSQLEKAVSLTRELKSLLTGLSDTGTVNITISETPGFYKGGYLGDKNNFAQNDGYSSKESPNFSGEVHSKIIKAIEANCK